MVKHGCRKTRKQPKPKSPPNQKLVPISSRWLGSGWIIFCSDQGLHVNPDLQKNMQKICKNIIKLGRPLLKKIDFLGNISPKL